ncbi:GNAT family N-acetyltransferase, partial [Klebsiella aerogenes]
QGLGYGYESLCALCDYAFSTGGIRRLTASVTAGNQASRQLLLKTGFIQEG